MSKVVHGLSKKIETKGFTIVETFIVLAVSSALAVSALLLVSGTQNKTQFRVAALGLKQQLEQTINETRNGYYPGGSSIKCTQHTPQPIVLDTGGEGQGTQSDCIFLGKVLAFGVNDAGTSREAYTVFPIVGNRLSGANSVQNFTQSGSKVLDSLKTQGTTRNGLSFQKVTYTPVVGIPVVNNNVAVLGFLDSLNQYVTQADGSLASGVQTLNLYKMKAQSGWAPTNNNDVRDGIESPTYTHAPDEVAVITSITMCFNSGGTNQSAVYTITGKGQLSVTMTIQNGLCS